MKLGGRDGGVLEDLTGKLSYINDIELGLCPDEIVLPSKCSPRKQSCRH